MPILLTKLYLPPPRPGAVSRPHLVARLDAALALGCKLTLISAPAGFGKTTLVSEWVAAGAGAAPARRVAWLSLDAGDNDPARFLAYLVAALQTIFPDIGAGVLAALESPQPPPVEALLTTLLNELARLSPAAAPPRLASPAAGADFVLVLDDYHALDAAPVDQALTFLLDHMPPQMHLVIATREDPQLPLARYRVRGQLTELRAADLRFTPAEAAEFLNQTMGLQLSDGEIAALEARTEGWIAGLHMAALSLQGRADAASFIRSFSGSHHFVLDYLLEEVLGRQPAGVQAFLLRTSILDRLCGPLGDAVMGSSAPAADAQATLEHLDHANLFIVPLDNERRWYRYHHLFAELLRQRLGQSLTANAMAELHVRASQWYEDNGWALDAFRHATAANDIERAERLMESSGIPRHSRGALMAVLEWLTSLPEPVLDARPLLRVRTATMALMVGQTTGVEERLRAAEAALEERPQNVQTRDLMGQIAAARATLAVTQYRPDLVIAQAQRALDYLLPENLTFRFTANWTLSIAHYFLGDRAAANQFVAAALAICRVTGNAFATILATSHLGRLQEAENQLHLAAETYRRVLHMAGDQPVLLVNEAHLGLGHIHYQWNDVATAERHGLQSLQLTRLYDRALDRHLFAQVFLAHLKLAQGDAAGAAALLAEAEQAARQNHFTQRLPEIAAVQILTLLRQGQVAAAAQVARQHNLPLSRARVFLAQGDPAAALAVLEPHRQQAEARGWADELLLATVLQALALRLKGARAAAVQALAAALALAAPGGFIRLFLDEGEPMAELLSAAAEQGIMPDYVARLLAAFQGEGGAAKPTAKISSSPTQSASWSLVEPLSPRELEILKLIAQGLSNREIGERLFLALDTVKGHNRRIFEKLQVDHRTEAIARARALGLL
ncbi:MAG TPA: LuxR C-terminal-related transcriptional regulator [Anaerolineae bacterium]|nr:LuxR C-terminal-related transcriptional regulator [Anaerolineae bacterium]HNU05936.1 LuxR C-terminal-related transcriptional regulator [Anaerolineae bacterium]